MREFVIRVRGQQSILQSNFIHRQPSDNNANNANAVNDDERRRERVENAAAAANKKKKRPTTISLSDFLQRKLQKTSNNNNKGKDTPFLSPGTTANQFSDDDDGVNAADHKTKGLDILLLQNLKHNNKESVPFNVQDSIPTTTLPHVTNKSQIQDEGSQGLHGKPFASKGLVILGGDPMPKQAKYPKSFIRKEKALPVYNHYASGSGWWDSDMEGIDNDEVGFNEVWEGVGSATIGGLDWH